MYLIIDVGNTRVKAAVYQKSKLVELIRFDKKRILSEINFILKNYAISKAIISSVASISKQKLDKLSQKVELVQLSHTTKIPFTNLYKTPKTLGVDRIALVAAAVTLFPEKNVLIIDAGTCITYDFVTNFKKYLGGAISPGVELRYKSLHSFTANLPLLEKTEFNNIIGATSEEAIHSGVVNGVCAEMDGIINQYKLKFQDLTVVLTGGDANFLSKQLKSSIFVEPNFILEGLYTILTHTNND